MAASRVRSGRRIHIYELPFSVLNNICIILDTNNKWKELVTPLGFTVTDLYRFERCYYQACSSSASQTMIVEWGQQNHTIDELFCVLSGLQQRRAMSLLKEFVNPDLYHRLMSMDELSTRKSSIASAKGEEFWKTTDDDDDLPKPPKPSLATKQKRMPVQETEYGSARNPSLHSNTHSKQNGSHELDYQFSKLKVDPHNLNQPDSNSSLPSKMPLNSFFPSASNAHVNPCSELPSPPLPKFELQQPTSLSIHADESIEDNTKFPSTSQSSHLDRAEKIWQHPHQENRRPSDASSSKSRGTPSFAADSMLTSIQYDAIIAATEDFAPDKILGRGGFGVVYAGYWKNTKVAIKRIIKEINPGSTSLEDAKLQQSYAELQTLYKYRHDNILALYGYSEQEDGLCLVYQFMVNGSLEDRLLRKNGTQPLTWRQRLHIARGSACGIQFLHTCDIKPIIHGDIKSANILLDVNLEPKIGDFGLAREGPSSESTHRVVSAVHGTQPYLPEDYIKYRKLSTKVDTYSFGIVLFELATGLRAYDGQRKRNLGTFVMDCDKMKYDNLRDRTAGDEWSEAFLAFIHTGCQCAAPKKKDRPEMVQVLEFLENKLHTLEANEILDATVQNFSESTEKYNAGFKSNSALSNDVPSLSSVSEVDSYSDSAQEASQSSLSLNDTSIKENNCDIAPVVAYPNIPNLTALGTKQPS